MSPLGWLAFLAAAGIAAPARYLIDTRIQDRTKRERPWGTFVVNATGCFFAGALAGAVIHHGFTGMPVTVIGSGLLGAFTTFSTLTFETVRLAERGEVRLAAWNIGGSLAVGALAAAAGLALVGTLA